MMSKRVRKTLATIGLASALATGVGTGTASAAGLGEDEHGDWKDGTVGYKLGCVIAVTVMHEKVCGELWG